jgi:hypothetical protein
MPVTGDFFTAELPFGKRATTMGASAVDGVIKPVDIKKSIFIPSTSIILSCPG